MKSLARTQSNPKRGLRHRKAAQEFFDLVEPPCVLTDAEMDEALEQIDPHYAGSERGPHGRARWAGRLRMAASHSAMNTGRYFAYTIRLIGRGIWDVKAVQEAINLGVMLEAVREALEGIQRNERYLEEGVPVDRLPELERRQCAISQRYMANTLEVCLLHAEAALNSHREMIRACLQAGKLPELPEQTTEE